MVATAASASPARMRNGLVRRIGGRGAVVAATLVLSLARAMPGHAGAQPAPAAANHAPAQSPAAAEQAPAAPPASAPPAGPVSHPPEAAKQAPAAPTASAPPAGTAAHAPEAAKQAAVAPPASAPSPIAKTPFAEVFAQLAARLEAVVVNISTSCFAIFLAIAPVPASRTGWPRRSPRSVQALSSTPRGSSSPTTMSSPTPPR